ncbi:reverse transcriptase [Gossypium australe]|uniref:Reverse transcriptase n=1 Tax=Gossypium australe TaxID=47621 RepID=A0A5B6V930_9ROSI|nr:reverse transcriptase [Gossypium australe]
MLCVCTVSYFVVLNESVGNPFLPSRGLRQGDPLSPYLFLLCGEGLSVLLRFAQRDRVFGGVRLINLAHASPNSFLQMIGATTVQFILDEYIRCYGQKVNFDKSLIYFSTNMVTSECSHLGSLLECVSPLILKNIWVCHLWLGGKSERLSNNTGLQFLLLLCNVFLFSNSLCQNLKALMMLACFNDLGCLMSHVFKAKYFSNLDFLQAGLGSHPSLTWHSIWSSRGLLEKGLCWQGSGSYRIETTQVSMSVNWMSDLMQPDLAYWNVTLVRCMFSEYEAIQILSIPL